MEPERTVDNAFIAAEAVIEMAARQGLTRLVIPLIGAGVNGLDASEVAVALLRAIQKALVAKKPDSQKIQAITIVARQAAPIEAARRLFPDNYLAQRAYNDLAEGQDLLNIQTEVHALAEVLLMREMEPPLAVGILGGWGSGKSFVMHLMQQKMNEIRSLPVNADKAWDKQNNSNSSELFPYVGHIYQIKFDAWTYAKSNLWASLMETIFFELNRQLTLEKQLKEAGIDPLKEPQIWSVLNDMSNEKREALLESKLSPDIFKNWKKIVCTQGLANSLWENLQILKTAEQKALNETQQELLKREASLKETEKKLENEVNEEIAEEARNVVLRPITNKLKRELINTSLAELKKYLHLELNATDENGKQQNIEKVEITLEKRAPNSQSQNEINSSIPEDEPEALSPQAIKFSKTEFDIVLKCCKYIDLSPRTLKRMVNVYKLIKIIWFRSNQQIQVEKNQDLITVVVSFLAMSGRYPDIMRSVFDELKIYIEELEIQKEETANNTFKDFFNKYFKNYLPLYQDNYFRQEYKRFRDDVNTLLIPVNLTLEQSVLETFNIMRSFCFIGDIGYDPRDFISTAASHHQSNSIFSGGDKSFESPDVEI
ncbi:P-loop NTPase fold protein [Nostoc sp. ChiQUE01b]|uniref:P-loop NTPase fold protein n=1 Tax=Nostoc sp. ChiQUE01b TaxID=3075376 RepID=UPI002AD58A74|nr:P-loop NTPase fold protein [Nostoc sp. ChiQUE01b]MDZ8258755.1 P-loop NTPase fold protein [Nostoc sp. ChiQUE01b]